MMDVLFKTAGILLIISCLAAFWIKIRERLITLSLLQVLVSVPVLAGLYIFFAGNKHDPEMARVLIFGESAFAVVWAGLAYRLGRAGSDTREHRFFPALQCIAGAGFIALMVLGRSWPPVVMWTDRGTAIPHYGQAYFYAVFLLVVVLFAAWQLEAFWRTLEPVRRWAYKFLVVGGFLVCGMLGWAASYRLMYGLLVADHFYLLAVLLLAAWAFMGYAVARHKLLNRKIFISRKVVYSFVAPTVFAVYLVVLGLLGMLMQVFGFSMPFVLNWMAVVVGLIAVGVFAFSGRLRRRVKFFISTHFYVNKYEYRDEWLSLSARLKGAQTEAGVVEALREVMAGSLYASRIVIWTGDGERGYDLISVDPPLEGAPKEAAGRFYIAQDDFLVEYLASRECLNLQEGEEEKGGDRERGRVVAQKGGFLDELGIVLVAPLAIGDHVAGLIGLGPEFTGGVYGHDDYDLLIALGSQAASALMAVRMAEKLADERERRAWDRLSAFVLHDIKNAAAMLSLVRANASAHIHKPEFQEDMLEVVDDALARMDKVQQRLGTLKAEISPVWSDVDMQTFLREASRWIGRKLPGMIVNVNCPEEIRIQSVPDMLLCIMENLLLNAFEACEKAGVAQPAVQIEVVRDHARQKMSIIVTDNGPGIDPRLLPEVLFEPMSTTREKGSGIGLWQAKQLAARLNGSLEASNGVRGGACFVLSLQL